MTRPKVPGGGGWMEGTAAPILSQLTARCYNDMNHGEKIGSQLAGVGSPVMPAKDSASLVNPPSADPMNWTDPADSVHARHARCSVWGDTTDRAVPRFSVCARWRKAERWARGVGACGMKKMGRAARWLSGPNWVPQAHVAFYSFSFFSDFPFLSYFQVQFEFEFSFKPCSNLLSNHIMKWKIQILEIYLYYLYFISFLFLLSNPNFQFRV
jgi:hypothetical protein